MFVNNTGPSKELTKERWKKFQWKRASDYYGPGNFQLFDGVDPGDILMGGCNNCYMLAALSGIAEAHESERDADVN